MFLPTLGRVALWLAPLRGAFSCGGWCAGFVARLGSLFLFAVFVSPLLDSNPAWLLGPTANRFAHVIVGGVRFLCCPLRLMLLPVGGFPAFALAGGACASLFSLSRPCSGGSPRRLGGRAPCGRVRVVPFHLWLGRD